MTWRLSVHEELPSTQDAVLAGAAAGEADGYAVLALTQSAGRGTQGRPWRSPRGNLCLSVLLRPDGAARELPQWSLLAAVALADAVAGCLPDAGALRLKWPNDLLLGGAKAAGILTQAAPDGAGGIAWLAFGFGVNLAEAPPLPDRPTASLAGQGVSPPTPVDFAWRLLGALDRWRDRLAAEGFAPIRAAWMARGPAAGAPLTVSQAGAPLQGTYAGLAEDGRLLLCSKEGRIAVSSGEIRG
ncbi:biotin--[acetyl-CoA-carboxylase] ligase [Pseudoroseomonas deserti]|uniref:Biotin--[acetyl-CoA-carboxylase] ligase n=1 Tax=Teichococcus deserti TaxID=1817963 RepID=A0A1V2H7E1_9PROT|nr:biotin--[acetyl-CoA-carboxylase] ligase [Pseudoroseomonas deserti]ONG57239.1 biotin--[acetyl-CoA-carboxylase] ligase [Pseudoroseomonas deserti]